MNKKYFWFYKLNIIKKKSFREEHSAFNAYSRGIIRIPDNVELIIGKVPFFLQSTVLGYFLRMTALDKIQALFILRDVALTSKTLKHTL